MFQAQCKDDLTIMQMKEIYFVFSHALKEYLNPINNFNFF